MMAKNYSHFFQELQNCFQTDVADVKKGRRSGPAHSQMKKRKKGNKKGEKGVMGNNDNGEKTKGERGRGG